MMAPIGTYEYNKEHAYVQNQFQNELAVLVIHSTFYILVQANPTSSLWVQFVTLPHPLCVQSNMDSSFPLH